MKMRKAMIMNMDASKAADMRRIRSILLIGQSNMAGRGDFGEVPAIEHPRCLMMRNGRWIPMSEPINPDRAIFDAPFHSGIGLSASFAEAMAEANPDVKIGLIPCADGGTSLDDWTPGGLLYDNAVFQVRQARRTSEVAAILWHQGENDSHTEADASAYRRRIADFFDHLRKDAGLDGVPLVIGELGRFLDGYRDGRCRYWRIVNKALNDYAESDPLVAIASSAGLKCKPDGVHFDSASQREFGRRYFKAYQSLTAPCAKVLHPVVSTADGSPCLIGEGPIWNQFDGKLYHVNGYGRNEIRAVDLATGRTEIRKLPFSVTAIAFSAKGEMLVSCPDGAFILKDDGSRRPLYDKAKYEIRYGNDAKVGPDGCFYIGTQSRRRKGVGNETDGKFLRIDAAGNIHVLLDGLLLSNGFDWSMDERHLYHTDSETGLIREYDFYGNCAGLSFTGRQVEVRGVDGLTIDREDRLYVACWGQGHIAVVDTATMAVTGYIDIPARIPASCCFAGSNLDKLAVVTATLGADMTKDANAGRTFILEGVSRGRKPYLFGAMR